MAATGTPSFTLSPELRRTSSVVVLGSIMSILDTTIVAVALATLGRDFHVSVTTIQWVATGYLLALSIVIPVTGWAVDRFGAKLVWMTSLTLFIIGSCLCGVAWSANSLIAFRVVQGIGGGMLLPVGQSILARAAGPQRMGRVMSTIGVPLVLGPTGFCLPPPGLAALVYFLAEVGTTGRFTSMSVVVSFALGVLLMAGFI